MAKFTAKEVEFISNRISAIYSSAIAAEARKWDKANPRPPRPAAQYGSKIPTLTERRVATGKLASEKQIRYLAKCAVEAGRKTIGVHELFAAVSPTKHAAAERKLRKYWESREKFTEPLRQFFRKKQSHFMEKVRLNLITAEEALDHLHAEAKLHKFDELRFEFYAR